MKEYILVKSKKEATGKKDEFGKDKFYFDVDVERINYLAKHGFTVVCMTGQFAMDTLMWKEVFNQDF